MTQPGCHHENVKKLKYLREAATNGVHGPYSEIWLVRCLNCSAEFEELICQEVAIAWPVKPFDIFKDPEFVSLTMRYLDLLRSLHPDGKYWPEGGGCPH